MLTDLRVHTTIPAADMDRAMRWYEEKLNFKPLWKRPAGAMYQAGDGTRFQLYPTPNAGQAPQTVMGLSTRQIATVENVRAAWFRDSEGNILGLAQFTD